MLQISKQMQQHADYGTRVMETGDHFKNGASPKSLMSRGNWMKKVILFFTVIGFSCALMAQTASDYRTDAEKGDKVAQFNLGVCYDTGKGVTKDATQAVYWYRKAAEQGYAQAQFNLGVCYKNGEGVTKDATQAVYWYRKAAEQGYAPAQFNLGSCYGNGYGVTKDGTQAVYWYRKAAEQGNARAQYNLGFCYNNGEGVTKDATQAVYWFRKATEQGYARAQCNLGICYENGEGVSQDKNTALYWYEKALQNKKDLSSAQIITLLETRIKTLKDGGYSSSRAKIDSGNKSTSKQNTNNSKDFVPDYTGTPSTPKQTSNKSWKERIKDLVKNNPTLTYKYDGGMYKGEVANGKPNGWGVNIIPGNIYDIQFSVFESSVQGSNSLCTFPKDGRIWIGDRFSNGTFYKNDGSIDHYMVKDNFVELSTEAKSIYKFEIIKYSNGDQYAGETKKGIRHGMGIYLWANGDIWYGQWEDGTQKEKGITFFSNGNIKVE